MNKSSFNYPVEVLLAFGEAVKKKEQFKLWLEDNGYEHLAQLSLAISNDKKAFNWLVKNFPQYAAFDRAIDNDVKAKIWLKNNELEFDIIFADACAGKTEAIAWLVKNELDIFLRLAKIIKNDIDSRQRYRERFMF